MKKPSYQEWSDKFDAAETKRREAIREAERIYFFETDLANIHYYGMNWLDTGKVGGWDRLPEEFDF